jgi:hypothetical protein
MLAPTQGRNLKKKPSIIFNNLKGAQEFQSQQSHESDQFISPLYTATLSYDFDSEGFDGAIGFLFYLTL